MNKDINVDQQMINQEVNKIMNKIYDLPERKINLKKLISYPVLAMCVGFIFIFSFRLSLFDSGPDFSLNKVSANEYEINYKKSMVSLNIYTLVENDELIKINDDMSYYSGFNKYINVTSLSQVKNIEIQNKNFIHAKIDNRIDQYYEVYEAEHVLILIQLDYNFSNFEKEMKDLQLAMIEYPPIIKEVNLKEEEPGKYAHDYIYNQYKPNPNSSELDSELYNLYLWYINKLDATSRSTYDKDDYYKFVFVNIMDGDKENLGNIKERRMVFSSINDNSKGLTDFNDYEFPVKIKDCDIKLRNRGLDDVKIYINYTNQSCSNGYYSNSALPSAIIDFSNYTERLNIDDYEIKIKAINHLSDSNEEIVVSKENMLVFNNRLYILPVRLKSEEGKDVLNFTYQINIKDTNGKTIFYENQTYIIPLLN